MIVNNSGLGCADCGGTCSIEEGLEGIFGLGGLGLTMADCGITDDSAHWTQADSAKWQACYAASQGQTVAQAFPLVIAPGRDTPLNPGYPGQVMFKFQDCFTPPPAGAGWFSWAEMDKWDHCSSHTPPVQDVIQMINGVACNTAMRQIQNQNAPCFVGTRTTPPPASTTVINTPVSVAPTPVITPVTNNPAPVNTSTPVTPSQSVQQSQTSGASGTGTTVAPVANTVLATGSSFLTDKVFGLPVWVLAGGALAAFLAWKEN